MKIAVLQQIIHSGTLLGVAVETAPKNVKELRISAVMEINGELVVADRIDLLRPNCVVGKRGLAKRHLVKDAPQ